MSDTREQAEGGQKRRLHLPAGVEPRTAGSAISETEAATPERIGQRIRAVRNQRGMSAKDLASAAEVTPGMISQVESGAVSPSIATLLRVAGALHVSVGELFDEHAAVGRVMRVEDRLLLDYPGSGVRDEIVSADPSGSLQVFWCEMEPGAGSGDEPLQHGSAVEFAMVLFGKAAIDLGTETVELDVGETVTFSGRTPHRYRNTSEGHTTLLWVTTPSSF
jgi:transcriptional regulator with XRE-family HTH domain